MNVVSVGVKVRHKNGGPVMTVASEPRELPVPSVVCEWPEEWYVGRITVPLEYLEVLPNSI